ncbi:hypothetical protein I79_017399 [Cricetulus griseus]|uniref:Uncharacterized protein n=1 Tax=Cricetulus griseus TaxID=10029 RepID=G3I1X0_CRIGR|nr:hypothetical protein I79_017399 [Cricetulus griseus]
MVQEQIGSCKLLSSQCAAQGQQQLLCPNITGARGLLEMGVFIWILPYCQMTCW